MRGFQEQVGFDEAVARVFGSTPNADEALQAAQDVLCRADQISAVSTEIGLTKHGMLRACVTKPTAAWPSVILLFTVSRNGEQIEAWDLKLAD